MAREIERKFLVTGDGWRRTDPLYCRQGYLCTDEERTVRVRIVADRAYLTVKGRTVGCVRSEYEYPLPPEDAEEMLALCVKPIIDKHRHVVTVNGGRWEVDEFHRENEGLVIAEIELVSEDQEITLPDWIGREVTDDPRYYNANLARHPFSEWSDS